MKKECKTVRRSIVLALCVMLVGLLVGCGKEAAVTPEPSTSEVVSEKIVLEEVSETIAEEVSEPVREEPSEEVVTEELPENNQPEVEITNFSNYDDFFAYLKERNETIIIYYDFSKVDNMQAILPNNSKYTLLYEDSNLRFYPSKKVHDIAIASNYISYIESRTKDGGQIWSMTIETTGTDIEVPITITYEDDTVEEYTVYITTAGQ